MSDDNVSLEDFIRQGDKELPSTTFNKKLLEDYSPPRISSWINCTSVNHMSSWGCAMPAKTIKVFL